MKCIITNWIVKAGTIQLPPQPDPWTPWQILEHVRYTVSSCYSLAAGLIARLASECHRSKLSS
jgi:hypothetical protein